MTKTHNVPQGTMSQKLVEAGVPQSNFVYFDLLETIDEQLVVSTELKARVFSSMAWMLDNSIINEARAVFFETYRESLGAEGISSIDKWNEFIATMNDTKAAGEHVEEVGFSASTSYDKLCTMLNMRKFWHDEAQRVATRPYEPKSLAELLASEKVRTTGVDSRAKLQMRAQFASPTDEAIQKKILESLIGKNDANLAKQHALRQSINPAVLRILEMATNSASVKPSYDGECPPFHEMPQGLRVSLVNAAIGAVERGLANLANISSVTLDDYAVAMKEGIDLQSLLKRVLQAPAYKTA